MRGWIAAAWLEHAGKGAVTKIIHVKPDVGRENAQHLPQERQTCVTATRRRCQNSVHLNIKCTQVE